MRKILFLIVSCISLAVFSQQVKRNAPVTVRGIVGIPRGLTSAKFRTAFAGLAEINLSVNARTFSNFFVGLGYQASFFKNNSFAKYAYFNASLPYNTRMRGNAGFLKIGYDQFFQKVYVSYSLNTGYMFVKYANVNKDTSEANRPYIEPMFGAPFVQPEIAINFLADRSLTFSLILSYTTLFNRFDARGPRFAQFGEIADRKNRYFSSWLNIGFGFNILIHSK